MPLAMGGSLLFLALHYSNNGSIVKNLYLYIIELFNQGAFKNQLSQTRVVLRVLNKYIYVVKHEPKQI